MATILRLLAVALAAGSLAGCALTPTTDHPYPVHGNPVNPTPVHGYRVLCRTVPTITYPVFDDFTTGCRQVIPAYREEVVVRAAG